ncbi:MAG: tetratricopeptide repeat protein, partial [Myxococcota bacterium]
SGAAVEFLNSYPKLDLRDPGNAPALRSLVAHAFDAGAPETAGTVLEAALSEHPDSSAFQAIRGFSLERGGAPASSVREAYELAVELDPENALAIGALARLEEARGKPEEALDLYARAITASPGDLTLERSAAMLSARMGRAAEAERRLEDLLRENPHDAETAIELATLRIARGADEAGTQELVARAERFGGSSAAERLIEVEGER